MQKELLVSMVTPGFAVQNLSVMQYLMNDSDSLDFYLRKITIVKLHVKLAEPPYTDPYVRWCERSGVRTPSYSILGDDDKMILIGIEA